MTRGDGAGAATAVADATPTREDLVERARALARDVRARAAKAEFERKVSLRTAEEYTAAGLVRTLVPRRWGGYELDFLSAFDVCVEVSRADASTGWVTTFWTQHAYMIALLPEQAQEDVWTNGPDARVATSVAPRGTVTAADGGYVLDGQWSYASGIDQSSWMIVGSRMPETADEPAHNRMFLVPVEDGTVVDTWHSAGMQATGSNDFKLENVFVPAHRSASAILLREGRAPGTETNPNPIYQAPLMSSELYSIAGSALGAAKGGVDSWLAFAREKRHVYSGLKMTEEAPVQIRFAELTGLVDAAELLLRRGLTDVQTALYGGDGVSVDLRVRNRRDFTLALRLLVQATELLMQLGGASSMSQSNPLQRAWRDVHAAAAHVIMSFDTAGENFGRLSFDLPLNPKDPFF